MWNFIPWECACVQYSRSVELEKQCMSVVYWPGYDVGPISIPKVAITVRVDFGYKPEETEEDVDTKKYNVICDLWKRTFAGAKLGSDVGCEWRTLVLWTSNEETLSIFQALANFKAWQSMRYSYLARSAKTRCSKFSWLTEHNKKHLSRVSRIRKGLLTFICELIQWRNQTVHRGDTTRLCSRVFHFFFFFVVHWMEVFHWGDAGALLKQKTGLWEAYPVSRPNVFMTPGSWNAWHSFTGDLNGTI